MQEYVLFLLCCLSIISAEAGKKRTETPYVPITRVKKFAKQEVNSDDSKKLNLSGLSVTDLNGLEEMIDNCTHLDLSKNQLSTSVLTKLAKYCSDKLLYINLSQNCIGKIDPNTIDSLKDVFPCLKKIDIWQNPIPNLEELKVAAEKNKIDFTSSKPNDSNMAMSIPYIIAPQHYSNSEESSDEYSQ